MNQTTGVQKRVKTSAAGTADLGRGRAVESLIERQEAAERRLSSTLQLAESVDSALGAFEQQLADIGTAHTTDALRASVRALLVVAYHQEDYDVTLVPASGGFGVRIRNTIIGLQAQVIGVRRPSDSRSGSPNRAES